MNPGDYVEVTYEDTGTSELGVLVYVEGKMAGVLTKEYGLLEVPKTTCAPLKRTVFDAYRVPTKPTNGRSGGGPAPDVVKKVGVFSIGDEVVTLGSSKWSGRRGTVIKVNQSSIKVKLDIAGTVNGRYGRRNVDVLNCARSMIRHA